MVPEKELEARNLFILGSFLSGVQVLLETGIPRWLSGKESACKAGGAGSIPRSG